VTNDLIRSPLPYYLDLSPLRVLRSLEVADWIIPFEHAGSRRTMMETFSSITSLVFSKLVMVVRHERFSHLLSDTPSFDILHTMRKVRPFALVFFIHVFGHLSMEGERTLDETLESAVSKGLFDFLDSPPIARFRQIPAAGSPGFDWVPRVPRYQSYWKPT